MKTQGTVDVETRGEVAILRMASGGRNPLTIGLRVELIKAFRQIKKLTGIKAVVLTAKGTYFSSGLALDDYDQATLSPSVYDVARAIADCELPVIAALQGHALDAGFELALAAHFRLAINTAKVGFEAIENGLLPSGGATQRLPRIIGAKNSLALLLSGDRVPVTKLGHVFDAVVKGDFDAHIDRFVQRVLDTETPIKRGGDLDGGLADPAAFQAEIGKARENMRGKGQAHAEVIRCIEAASLLPFEAGLAFEEDAFEVSLRSDLSHACRHLLRAERTARQRVADMDEGAWDVHKVAILGATRMAVGMAAVCLCASIGVIMIVPGEEMVRVRAAVRAQIERLLKHKRRDPLGLETIIEQFELAPYLEDAVNCDMVIDFAAGSQMDKLERFTKLGEFMPGHSVLATGVAQGGIEALGGAATRVRQVIGIYPVAPVEIAPVVELAKTQRTSQVVLATMARFISRLEKFAVVSEDRPGLIGNTVQMALFEAAERLVFLGVDFEDIDESLRDFGFPMGPFRLWDLGRGPKNGRLARAMAERGFTGRKQGAGYYLYDEGQTHRMVNQNALRLIEALRDENAGIGAGFSDADIQFFCVAAMANAGAKLLEDGVALSASDVDLIMTLGHNFPRERGGPMKAADLYGLLKMRKLLDALAVQDAFWAPSPVFDELIKNGKKFSEMG